MPWQLPYRIDLLFQMVLATWSAKRKEDWLPRWRWKLFHECCALHHLDPAHCPVPKVLDLLHVLARLNVHVATNVAKALWTMFYWGLHPSCSSPKKIPHFRQCRIPVKTAFLLAITSAQGVGECLGNKLVLHVLVVGWFQSKLVVETWVSAESRITHFGRFGKQSGDITVVRDAESAEHSLLCPLCFPHSSRTRWWRFSHQINCSSESTVVPSKNFPARRFQVMETVSISNTTSYGHSYRAWYA